MMDRAPDDGAKKVKAHVLVVDDEPICAMALERFLERRNYQVSIAANGEQALQLHAEASVDAVVTDFRMPKLNGGELTVRLRSIRPDLPVVIVTGYAPEIPDLRLDPPVPVIEKPVNPVEVVELLDSWFPQAGRRLPSSTP